MTGKNPWKPTFALAAYLIAAYGFERAVSYHPYLLMRWQSAMAGAVAGLALCILLGVAHSLFLLWRQNPYADCLRLTHEELSNKTSLAIANQALTAAFGKDLLVRAYIFGYLMADHLTLAFLANLVLTILMDGPRIQRHKPFIGFLPGNSVPVLVVEIIKTSFLAAVFLAQRSVFVLALTRLIQYLVGSLLLRSDWFGRWLNRRHFNWRSLYELSPYADERTSFNI